MVSHSQVVVDEGVSGGFGVRGVDAAVHTFGLHFFEGLYKSSMLLFKSFDVALEVNGVGTCCCLQLATGDTESQGRNGFGDHLIVISDGGNQTGSAVSRQRILKQHGQCRFSKRNHRVLLSLL